MIKRQRGRGRNPGQKPQNNNPNRAYESNGPDLKVRGSAQTVFEKYQQLGRDAQSNGDRVLGENYMQHAEHYFRVLRAMQPTFVPRSELMIAGYDDEEYESEDTGATGEGGEGDNGEGQNGSVQPEFQQNRPQRDGRDRDNRDREGRDRDGRDRDYNQRDNNRNNNGDRAPREFRDNRDAPQNREPREPRDPNEPRLEGEESRFGRRRRRPDRPERFGNENGAQTQSDGDQGARPDTRNDTRRDPRPDFRSEGGQAPNLAVEATQSFAQPEFVQAEFAQPTSFSDPQEIIVSGDPAPARERRPRPPRAPRAPRETAPAVAETGFGNELPAFLATPVPVTSGD